MVAQRRGRIHITIIAALTPSKSKFHNRKMVLSLDRWVGKVAVVTGASSGIGVAIVDQLVEKGLIVVGVARRVELIDKHAKELSGKKGKLIGVKADISKEEEIVKAFKHITENIGPIHVLVNNAGVSRPTNLIGGNSEIWKQTLDVNVLGLCIATREAIESMKKHQIHGHIFHINSVAGHTVLNFPNINIYPASKFAVTALTETLRNELTKEQLKIKITSISPGLVTSEMTTLNKEHSKDLTGFLQQQPILNPEDIADGLVYALSTPEHVQVHELTIKPLGEIF